MDGSADGDEVWEPLAAVLDTSFLHGGKFDRDQVEHLAQRLSQRDVKLWIPQQVIYEWAAHAAGALEALRSAQDLLRKSEILDAELPNKSKTAIVDEIQAMCEAMDNVVIVPMGGEAAAAAIRDQILGEGAGGVSKDGTRTGAVDSLIVRDAVRLVDEDLEKLVFLTGNKKDFNPAVKHLGLSGFQFATSIKLLLEKLRRPSAPPPQWRPAMTAIVASLMRDIRKATETDDRSGPPRAWIEVSDVKIGDLDDHEREDIEELVLDRAVLQALCSVQLVGVRAVSVEADGDAEIIGYTVVLLGDIAVVGAVIDNDGQAVFTSTTLQDRLIFADYEATLKDGQLGPAQQIEQRPPFMPWKRSRIPWRPMSCFATPLMDGAI